MNVKKREHRIDRLLEMIKAAQPVESEEKAKKEKQLEETKKIEKDAIALN